MAVGEQCSRSSGPRSSCIGLLLGGGQGEAAKSAIQRRAKLKDLRQCFGSKLAESARAWGTKRTRHRLALEGVREGGFSGPGVRAGSTYSAAIARAECIDHPGSRNTGADACLTASMAWRTRSEHGALDRGETAAGVGDAALRGSGCAKPDPIGARSDAHPLG